MKNHKLILASICLPVLTLSAFLFSPTINVSAESISKSSDLIVNVAPVLSLALQNCPTAPDPDETSLTLNLIPTPSGTFRSNCQKVSIDTNAPGYTLLAKASGSHPQVPGVSPLTALGNITNALIYQNPTSLVSPNFPIIPATTSPISSPSTLTPNYWGFALDQSQTNVSLSSQPTASFIPSSPYSVNTATNTFANLPTIDTTMYQTTTPPNQTDTFNFFYGVNVASSTPAGTYLTTVTYTAVGEEPAPVIPNYNGADITTIDQRTCSNSVPIGTVFNVIDTRNNQNYNIRCMEDEKYWMIDNLKIANFSATSANTDLNTISSFTIPALDTTSVLNYDLPYVYGPVPGNSGIGATNYGYLYNWSVATAGESRVSMPAGSGNAPNSICPAGWRLPVGTSTGDFAVLNASMQAGSLSAPSTSNYYSNWHFSGPFRGVFAGTHRYGFNLQGLSGVLWSSTADVSPWVDDAFYAEFESTYIDPGSSGSSRDNGFSIRCILK